MVCSLTPCMLAMAIHECRGTGDNQTQAKAIHRGNGNPHMAAKYSGNASPGAALAVKRGWPHGLWLVHPKGNMDAAPHAAHLPRQVRYTCHAIRTPHSLPHTLRTYHARPGMPCLAIVLSLSLSLTHTHTQVIILSFARYCCQCAAAGLSSIPLQGAFITCIAISRRYHHARHCCMLFALAAT